MECSRSVWLPSVGHGSLIFSSFAVHIQERSNQAKMFIPGRQMQQWDPLLICLRFLTVVT